MPDEDSTYYPPFDGRRGALRRAFETAGIVAEADVASMRNQTRIERDYFRSSLKPQVRGEHRERLHEIDKREEDVVAYKERKQAERRPRDIEAKYWSLVRNQPAYRPKGSPSITPEQLRRDAERYVDNNNEQVVACMRQKFNDRREEVLRAADLGPKIDAFRAERDGGARAADYGKDGPCPVPRSKEPDDRGR